MELRWPLVVLGLAALVVALLLWWLRERRPTTVDAVLVAHADRLRSLPRYRALALRQFLISGVSTAGALVMLSGCVLLAARPQASVLDVPEQRSRDIQLCLDASGSMAAYNVEVVGEFRRIVDGLRGERIGLTVFSGAAVSIFPLTDDYEFVKDRLDDAERAFASNDYDFVAGTVGQDDRSSQMGDGLVSCVQRFDRPGEERGRAVVIASDNDPQGPPLFTIAEAADYARARDVVVYGIGSPELASSPEDAAEFVAGMTRTGGTYSQLGHRGGAESIVEGIERLERMRLDLPPRAIRHDDPAPAAAIAGAGLLVLLAGCLLGRRR